MTNSIPAFGDSLAPLSDNYGFERGTPLDRKYIEDFLSHCRHVIRGSVLEVTDSLYTTRFGGGHVSRSAVVDIDVSNPLATLVADLTEPDSLPAEAYDCIILTQTLHLLSRPGRCLETCHRALRSGGSLLLTAPTLSRVSPSHANSDFWRFTPAGIKQLFCDFWTGPFSIESFGNLRICVGFLLAEVVEEIPEDTFAVHDPRFPLTVAVHAQKQ